MAGDIATRRALDHLGLERATNGDRASGATQNDGRITSANVQTVSWC